MLAFLALFLINPILESLTGRTFGKYIFGMRVMDDYGENPSLLTSFIKNILQLFSIVFYLLSSATIVEDETFFHNKKKIYLHDLEQRPRKNSN
ncbi:MULTISPECIES: RDD family protein [Cellulophaga]|uniref:RDD family protein n=1 Tax=Cellulophaga TaxID=104264 RepID=UPI00059F72E0